MKIAIIGNGTEPENKKCGNFINSCDAVIRINLFNLNKCYYDRYGSKTTHIYLSTTPTQLINYLNCNNFKNDYKNYEHVNCHLKTNKNIICENFSYNSFITDYGYLSNDYTEILDLNVNSIIPSIYSNFVISETFNKKYFKKCKVGTYRLLSDEFKNLLYDKYSIKWEIDTHRISTGLLLILIIRSIYSNAEIFTFGFATEFLDHYWNSDFISDPDHHLDLEKKYIDRLSKFDYIKKL